MLLTPLNACTAVEAVKSDHCGVFNIQIEIALAPAYADVADGRIALPCGAVGRIDDAGPVEKVV